MPDHACRVCDVRGDSCRHRLSEGTSNTDLSEWRYVVLHIPWHSDDYAEAGRCAGRDWRRNLADNRRHRPVSRCTRRGNVQRTPDLHTWLDSWSDSGSVDRPQLNGPARLVERSRAKPLPSKRVWTDDVPAVA